MQQRTPVQHAFVQRPFLADEGLGPRARRGDNLKHVRPRCRHDGDDALRVRDDLRTLDGHGGEQIPQGHGVARVGAGVIEEAPDELTDRLVDAACLVAGR